MTLAPAIKEKFNDISSGVDLEGKKFFSPGETLMIGLKNDRGDK